jgi:tRNA 2-thiouridine synthesizing protein A
VTGSGGDEVVVDARGLRCPLPVIRLAAAARDLPAGSVVVVLATDPAADHDVPAWARMRGHAWVGGADDEEPGVRRLTVRTGAADRAAG